MGYPRRHRSCSDQRAPCVRQHGPEAPQVHLQSRSYDPVGHPRPPFSTSKFSIRSRSQKCLIWSIFLTAILSFPAISQENSVQAWACVDVERLKRIDDDARSALVAIRNATPLIFHGDVVTFGRESPLNPTFEYEVFAQGNGLTIMGQGYRSRTDPECESSQCSTTFDTLSSPESGASLVWTSLIFDESSRELDLRVLRSEYREVLEKKYSCIKQ